MGQICLWQNRLMDLEIIKANGFTLDSKLDFYEHHEFDKYADWGCVLNNFLNFMI